MRRGSGRASPEWFLARAAIVRLLGRDRVVSRSRQPVSARARARVAARPSLVAPWRRRVRAGRLLGSRDAGTVAVRDRRGVIWSVEDPSRPERVAFLPNGPDLDSDHETIASNVLVDGRRGTVAATGSLGPPTPVTFIDSTDPAEPAVVAAVDPARRGRGRRAAPVSLQRAERELRSRPPHRGPRPRGRAGRGRIERGERAGRDPRRIPSRPRPCAEIVDEASAIGTSRPGARSSAAVRRQLGTFTAQPRPHSDHEAWLRTPPGVVSRTSAARCPGPGSRRGPQLASASCGACARCSRPRSRGVSRRCPRARGARRSPR